MRGAQADRTPSSDAIRRRLPPSRKPVMDRPNLAPASAGLFSVATNRRNADTATSPLAPRLSVWACRSLRSWSVAARSASWDDWQARLVETSRPPPTAGHLRGMSDLATAQHQIGRAQMDGRSAGAEAEAAHGRRLGSEHNRARATVEQLHAAPHIALDSADAWLRSG
jgi:hypothetical protein